ncbi:hypothetical protein VNO80_05809 [Phaseolus coccineus]|uniref:Uncharacterized protein n=1 Tax=Phaseolus coccineus TaxID=3886 RepID=A0AAN9NGY6_PHACN
MLWLLFGCTVQVFDLSDVKPHEFVRYGLSCLEMLAGLGDSCAKETLERIKVMGICRLSGKAGSNITLDQIVKFVAKQVSPYKKIQRVSFVNFIPESPARTILRRELVDYALSSGSSKL